MFTMAAATMESIESAPTASGKKGAVTDSSTAAARRAKKREQDRRCQRLARERTKNRLAYLEGMVSQLKQQDTTKQVQAVWKERDEIAAERDVMAQALQTIVKAIQGTGIELPAIGEMIIKAPKAPSSPLSRDDVIIGEGANVGEDVDTVEDINIEEDVTAPQTSLAASNSNLTQQPLQAAAEAWPTTGEETNSTWDIATADLMPDSNGSHKLSIDWSDKDSVFSNHNSNTIIPCPMGSCECTPAPSTPTPHDGQLNPWRFANETLSEFADWSPLISMSEDALKDDTPIRALIEGWDAAEKRAGGNLPKSWKKLRRIDETLFSTCGKTERLAILRTMHSLHLYHQDRSLERRAAVPQWYLARPSQDLAHSYAIDYLAWPGLRERFVFHQHQYCSSKFWRRFSTDFRILWPYEFRDCYSRNSMTGQYKFNPAFQERIGDIRAWTMAVDMFNSCPEFLPDIPVYNSVLRSLSPSVPQKRHLSGKEDWASAVSGSANSRRIRRHAHNAEHVFDADAMNDATSHDMDDLIPVLTMEDSFPSYKNLDDLLFLSGVD